jgi:cyclophilin family peptidyl-prolyl cis-trans isomerase
MSSALQKSRPLAGLLSTLSLALGLSLSGAGLNLLLPQAAQAQSAAKKPAAKKSKKAVKKTSRAKPRKNAPPSAIAGSAASPGMLAAAQATDKATAGDAAAVAAAAALKASGGAARGLNDILNSAPAEAWREADPQNLVLMDFKLPGLPEGSPSAQVIMELAPQFAPQHAANIRALVRGAYFDGLAVLRVQDNFVTQWGDPGEGTAARPLPAAAQSKLPAEFDVALAGLTLHALTENDGWAPLSGFVDGFAVAADPAKTPQGRAWLAHCYGAVGAGRGNEIDSSNGSSLYAIIGQPARSLDLNITVVGRVIKGIEHLAALPRGTGSMGFYGAQESRPPLLRARLAADLPEAERPSVKVLRTDSAAWFELLHSRRHRSGWFVHSSGRVDLCSTTVPVRIAPPATP